MKAFVKIEYLVSWAGADKEFQKLERTFEFFDEAKEFFMKHHLKPSARIEEVAVKIQIKKIWPETRKL